MKEKYIEAYIKKKYNLTLSDIIRELSYEESSKIFKDVRKNLINKELTLTELLEIGYSMKDANDYFKLKRLKGE